MQGIVRPCRHTLGKDLHLRWRSHLCGLCLTLRETSGQASRVLTGYDTLLLSVLVEAQAGRAETVTAGPCPLRGLRPAEVVPADSPGTRLAAAGALLAGAAGLEDKSRDRDLPAATRPAARRFAAGLQERGDDLADGCGLDREFATRAGRQAAAAEATPGATLADLLAPSGQAAAELFGRTAHAAGRPGNEATLRRAGDAFGRLVHLLDAVEDYGKDARRRAFNPLAATRTEPEEAHRLAASLASAVRAAVSEAELPDGELALALFGPVLASSVEKAFGAAGPTPAERPRPLLGAAVAVAAVPAVALGIFGGRRPPRGYYDPYDPYYRPPGYGYGGGRFGRRGGFSCCDLLACDCCANMACDDCCGGGGDDCCVLCC